MNTEYQDVKTDLYINLNLTLKEYIILNWKTTTKVSKVLVYKRALCSKRYSIDLNLFCSQNEVERYTIVLSSLEKRRLLNKLSLLFVKVYPVNFRILSNTVIQPDTLFEFSYIQLCKLFMSYINIWFSLSTEENKLSAHSSVASNPFNNEVFKKINSHILVILSS